MRRLLLEDVLLVDWSGRAPVTAADGRPIGALQTGINRRLTIRDDDGVVLRVHPEEKRAGRGARPSVWQPVTGPDERRLGAISWWAAYDSSGERVLAGDYPWIWCFGHQVLRDDAGGRVLQGRQLPRRPSSRDSILARIGSNRFRLAFEPHTPVDRRCLAIATMWEGFVSRFDE